MKHRSRPSLAPALLGGVIVIAIIVVLGFIARPGRGLSDQTGALRVVAAESFWGSLAASLGGDRVQVTSIITNPDADPHDYEPSARDGRAVADAQYLILNGAGYDPWASKLAAAAQTDAPILNVGQLVGVSAGGNPHLWYSPDDVKRVIAQIIAGYKQLDPAGSAYYDERQHQYETTNLKQYNALITEIKSKYAGTPVGSSESIFSPLAQALGLNLITPPSFLAAISEGAGPTAADKATTDQQITTRRIKMYVYNSQNSTPDVVRQVEAAQAAGIPIVGVTETLTPAGTSFEAWQVRQLQSLRDALAGQGRHL
jgi:zinc/manganese transport system substrate-binding protein